jgi:hypothetical protein
VRVYADRNKWRATVLHTGYSLSTMASSTERCRKHRARRRAGVGQFELELPLAALGEILVQAGWLADGDRDDVGRLHAALEQALLEWCGAAE